MLNHLETSNREKKQMSERNKADVLTYYDTCWLNRFADGHNPKSFAMHFGIFENGQADNDAAKNQTNEFLVGALEISDQVGVSIADLGCGIGGTCLHIGRAFPNVKVIGVNISPTQIEVARKLVMDNGVDARVSFVQGDFVNTGLSSSSKTHAFAIESLWHASDKSAVFQEAYRLLRTDGKFAVIDYFQTKVAETEEDRELVHAFNIGWGAYEDGTGPVKTYEFDHEKNMLELGYRNVQTVSLLDKVMQGIVNSYYKAERKLTEGGLKENLVRHYNACIALKHLADRGIIDYGIILATK
jgi:SAM-dependent methyltransferase